MKSSNITTPPNKPTRPAKVMSPYLTQPTVRKRNVRTDSQTLPIVGRNGIDFKAEWEIIRHNRATNPAKNPCFKDFVSARPKSSIS